MTTKDGKRVAVVVAAICTLWGVGRAASSRFEQQREAFLKVAVTERARLGLANNNVQLYAKYPSPEIALCKMTTVMPGATAQVVLPGKFVPGTKFLFENDAIDVVNDAVTAAQYRATIRAAADALPCITLVHGFSPVSGATAVCNAVYVGGLPAWEFAAANGWTVRLTPKEEKLPPEGGEPTAIYMVQFYRRGESKPFEEFPGWMSLLEACPGGVYTVNLKLEEPTGSAPGGVEEYQKLAQRMADPNITPAEYEKLLQRMTALAENMQKQMEDMTEKSMQQAERQKRFEEFGCTRLEFSVNAGTASGNLDCRDATSGATKEVKITGTVKGR